MSGIGGTTMDAYQRRCFEQEMERRFDLADRLLDEYGIYADPHMLYEFELEDLIEEAECEIAEKERIAAELDTKYGAYADPELRAFYEKKRAESKHHLAVIGAVSRKLCNIIFAVLAENRPFEKRNP